MVIEKDRLSKTDLSKQQFVDADRVAIQQTTLTGDLKANTAEAGLADTDSGIHLI